MANIAFNFVSMKSNEMAKSLESAEKSEQEEDYDGYNK